MDLTSVLLFVAAGLCFGIVRTVNTRMKPKKYVRKPELSWDKLDGADDPSGRSRGRKG